MKICIPTKDDRGFEAEVADHFGMAPFFTVVDTDDGQVQAVPNPACHEQPHSCHHAQQLGEHGVQVVVCRGMGRGALSGLRAAGIDVFVPAADSVAEAVAAVRAGKVHPLELEAACKGGKHGHGHGHGLDMCGGGQEGHGHGRQRQRQRQRNRGRGPGRASR